MKQQRKTIKMTHPLSNEDLPVVVQTNVLNASETNGPLSPTSTYVLGRRQT
jgi:hypothetical protein